MSSELSCPICQQPVYKSPTSHSGYYKVKSNGEVKEAQVDLDSERYHKRCAKCSICNCYVLPDTFKKDNNSILYCLTHYPVDASDKISTADTIQSTAYELQPLNHDQTDGDVPRESITIDSEQKSDINENTNKLIDELEPKKVEENVINSLPELIQQQSEIEKDMLSSSSLEQTQEIQNTVSKLLDDFEQNRDSVETTRFSTEWDENLAAQEEKESISAILSEQKTNIEESITSPLKVDEPVASLPIEEPQVASETEVASVKIEVPPQIVEPVASEKEINIKESVVSAVPIEQPVVATEKEVASVKVPAAQIEESVVPVISSVQTSDVAETMKMAAESERSHEMNNNSNASAAEIPGEQSVHLDDIKPIISTSTPATNTTTNTTATTNTISADTATPATTTTISADTATPATTTTISADTATPVTTTIPTSTERGLGDNVTIKMTSMADEYTANNAYEAAEQMYTKCLSTRKSKLGEEHLETLLNRKKLAILYTKWGKSAKAEQMYIKIYEINKETRGELDENTMASMSDLAQFYSDPSANHKKAEEILLPLLELTKQKYGEDSDESIKIIDLLANVCNAQDKKEKAIFYLEQCVELKNRKYGGNAPIEFSQGKIGNNNILKSIIKLADNYYNSKQYEKSEPLYLQVYEIMKTRLTESHEDTLKYMLQLAHVYKAQKKYTLATPLYESYLELQITKQGIYIIYFL